MSEWDKTGNGVGVIRMNKGMDGLANVKDDSNKEGEYKSGECGETRIK